MPSGSLIHISIKPHGSVMGPRMMGTPAVASRACSAWTSRTCIQIITDCPAGPGLCPKTSSKPEPRKNTTPGRPQGRTRGRWPGPVRRGRSGGCGPGRWAAPRSGCSERPCGYFSSTLSDTAGQRERAPAPPIGAAKIALPVDRVRRRIGMIRVFLPAWTAAGMARPQSGQKGSEAGCHPAGQEGL
jgi:hypothetical protein